ncbi:hypothetical protein N7447_011376 [Penicillium robsamsonii]|uniref:uncharacterized protein n=1 Tax=Penicillium robsamsonii TaxID=1792511 RepID=UPI002548A912|nr:uncharacterized protein N7447_011376 [Penicillium robsamsonii]KAJ5807143.1 hypothetical protein N7447_011376 [Penicillium robsamsonii]
MQPPAEGGFCLDSLRLNSPRPRQRPDPQPTGKHLPPPNRRPQSLSGAQGPSCCRRATPLPTAPSRKRRLQALLSPQWCPPTPPLPRGQHAIPSLPWPLNQLASILAAQIRARGPSSGFPLQAPGAAGSIDGEV